MAKALKLLLIENVDTLGIVGDVVNVRTGFARNFLLPRNLATTPSDDLIKQLAGKRADAQRMLAELRKQREELIGKLQGIEVTLIRSCNDQGVLYGSITQQDIATALNTMGHSVKPRDVRISQTMKRVDKFDVHVRLDSDLDALVKLTVQADRKLELERHEAESKTKDGAKDGGKGEHPPEGAPEQAAPAHAEPAPEKKEKKVKKDRPAGKEGKGDAAAAEPVADKKSVWGKPIDDSAKNLIPAARPRRERR